MAGTAAGSRTALTRSNPAPHRASATAARSGRAPGRNPSPSEARGEEQGPRDRGDADWRRRHASGDEDAQRQRGDEQGALDRRVAPHLDRQQDAEEQRSHEGGEHQTEPGVGEDLLAAPDTGFAVEVPFRAHRPGCWVETDEEGGGHDGGLDVEDRPPVEELREHAAEGWADDGPDGRRQHPPLARPLLAGDHGGEDGQRASKQQRRADALRSPGHEQHRQRRRRTGDDGGHGEDRRAGEHEPAWWEMAVEDRDRHGHDGDHEGVGRQHPRDADDRRVELRIEVRQRQRDDRRVGERQGDRGDEQHGCES